LHQDAYENHVSGWNLISGSIEENVRCMHG
jgi:hypothetical protein